MIFNLELNILGPPPKRNFIKENMKHIKYMQGLVHENTNETKAPASKLKCAPRLIKYKSTSATLPTKRPEKDSKSKSIQPQKLNRRGGSMNIKKTNTEIRLLDIGVQTEIPNDISQLYTEGRIVYPRKRINRLEDRGDTISGEQIEDLIVAVEGIHLNDKQFAKANMQTIKPPPSKPDRDGIKSKFPNNYQRGELPKYIKDKKDGKILEYSPDGPPGHQLLPDEERKDTLKILRQCNNDKI